ncbi:MAG: PIN domain-containing protein [Spirochaetales bacterium]|nr:PIN domain-containing protein [Spirochaetales bacterium]
MIKIFIDSDIILDLFLKRNEYESAAELMTGLVEKKYLGYTTPIVVANIHYIMTKLESKNKSIENIKKLRKFMSILTVDEEVIDDALSLGANDFEDSIQYIASEKYKMDFVITRNKKDYKKCKLTVLNAQEFLRLDEKS